MEEDKIGEYIIFGYMGDLEEAMGLAKKNGISGGTIREIESVHDGLVELSPLLKSGADYKRLKDDVGGLIEDLVKNSRTGDEDLILGSTRHLKDKVSTLKTMIEKT